MSQEDKFQPLTYAEMEIFLNPKKPEGVSTEEYVRVYTEYFTTGEVSNPPGWWIAIMDQGEAMLEDPEVQAKMKEGSNAFMAMVRAHLQK